MVQMYFAYYGNQFIIIQSICAMIIVFIYRHKIKTGITLIKDAMAKLKNKKQ